jgi:hypothetical protein
LLEGKGIWLSGGIAPARLLAVGKGIYLSGGIAPARLFAARKNVLAWWDSPSQALLLQRGKFPS